MVHVFVSEFFFILNDIENGKRNILAWCDSTCPGFCEVINDYYQCNCSKIPGFQLANFGRQCQRMRINTHRHIIKTDRFIFQNVDH